MTDRAPTLRATTVMAALAVSVSYFSSAQAEPTGRWWAGWGQGTAEYGYSSPDVGKVYIACDEGSGFGTSVSFTLQRSEPKAGEAILLETERESFEFSADSQGNLATDSHVGSDIFGALWAALRRDKTLTVSFGGKSAKFPLTGSAKVLPPIACETDFAR